MTANAIAAGAATLAGKSLELEVASGDALEVRHFSVTEQMSSLFQVSLTAVGRNAAIEFEAVAGQAARFTARGARERVYTGLVSHIEQARVESDGLSTYQLTLVPTLWLLTQRKNTRMFQFLSEPEIVQKLLSEWGIVPELRIDPGAYKKRKYRVQYGESDYLFLSRMLEDAGISFFFEDADGESKLVLSDAPHTAAPRGLPLPFSDSPSGRVKGQERVTAVRVGRRVRPGRYTMRDHDYRLPTSYPLMASSSLGLGVEQQLERYQYTPGAFLFGSDKGEANPSADDRGKTRTDEGEGQSVARKRLEAKQGSATACSFETNAHDLAPGVVMQISGHPRPDLGEGKKLLVVESTFQGSPGGDWTHECIARGTEIAYRPPLVTPKPKVFGVESATVVGPAGEEIHTDEFGRVRVHFHWDRESKMNEQSSCWIHVSQPWGGAGFGGVNLPRIGQEVLVGFLGGDPDRPVIVGRVYTNLQKVPYGLPGAKTKSGWKSMSSPGGGGYNEIMFEDQKGSELVNMQAEKDLKKLVKHDEEVRIGHDRKKLVEHDDQLEVVNDRQKKVDHDESIFIGHDRAEEVVNDESVIIGHDRTKQVGNDDRLAVGHDRRKSIGNDESVSVGHDRTTTVGNDEELTVGNDATRAVQKNERELVGQNRSRVVGVNESVEIGEDQQITIGGSQTVKIGDDQRLQVGESQSIEVDGSRSLSVSKTSSETVTLAKTVTVGGALSTTVGGAMSTTVGLLQTETVGLSKTVTVGQKIEIVCGAAKLVMESSGKVTITGTEISINGSKTKITGDPIELN